MRSRPAGIGPDARPKASGPCFPAGPRGSGPAPRPYLSARASPEALAEGGCWRSLWTRRSHGAAPVRPRAPGVDLRPPRPAQCSASSPSSRRATKSPVSKAFCLFRKVRLLIAVNAMHTQTADRETYMPHPESRYLMIIKSDQPKLLARLTAPPWTRRSVTATDDAHGHGRDERRTLKVLAARARDRLPYAEQMVQIARGRVAAATGERSRESSTRSQLVRTRPPAVIAAWLRRHSPSRTASITPRCDLRRGPLHRTHRRRPTGHGQHQKHRSQHPPPPRRRQYRRSLRVTAFSVDRGLDLYRATETAGHMHARQQRRSRREPRAPAIGWPSS